ncbi:tetratricopeptide (TPR) repeat protein [Luteibacter sp. Sphag1AF]|uniref:tetratricopeptide repeat protein n=1 Tax=Luteibacter sp. Sphag1AF TaxID=2587031 RepID=UPI001612DB33|nr:DUF4034 domain-containing protein [Luteibacter sp. Sphag1AF]MBB3227829.1 tetratricopeptide (TPR) repeat protein [Luteibacter sp. Sphag1AF]
MKHLRWLGPLVASACFFVAPVTTAQASPPSFAAFAAAAQKAEAIQDPLARCLAYPDPVGSSWNAQTTAAYCRMRLGAPFTATQAEALLEKGESAALDKLLAGKFREAKKDPVARATFDTAFRTAFGTADTHMRALLDRWVKERPESAFAAAASGWQFLATAEDARGSAYASQTSAGQLQTMHDYLARALPELERAQKLEPTLTTTYVAMLSASAWESGFADENDILTRGLAVDPTSFTLRIASSSRSTPRWGGSLQLVAAQRAQAMKFVDKNPLMRLVGAAPGLDDLACGGGDALPPADAVRQAVSEGVSMSQLHCAAYGAISDVGLYAELTSQIYRFDPNDAHNILMRFPALQRLDQKDWYRASLQQSHERDPGNAQLAIAYSNYLKVTETKRAIAVMQRSLATGGDTPAALHQLADLYLLNRQPDKTLELANQMIEKHPDWPDGYALRANVEVSYNKPDRYRSIHAFLDRFGDRPAWSKTAAELNRYLAEHPEAPSDAAQPVTSRAGQATPDQPLPADRSRSEADASTDRGSAAR